MNGDRPEEKFKIAIVGTGLIGCSIAEGLRDIASEIIGVDSNTAHLEEAFYRGWIDRSMTLNKAVNNADLVIISVPVDSSVRLLPLVLDQIDSRTVVIDAGSVKSAICRSIQEHPGRLQFVASHPMAGLAVSGPGAADSGLFKNRKVIICEREKSSEKALGTAEKIFTRLGLDIIYMEPDLHDLYVAKVSHLPQVVAYCLSLLSESCDNQKDPMINIASTGFESSTRLASSPASIWIPIFRHNNENLSGSLDDIINRLADVRDMIRNGRWQALTELIEKANKSREIFLSGYKQA